jgi:hypothetical protein
MLYIILAIDSITAQFMKDQTVLFGRLTHTDGYNAATGLIVVIKRKHETRPILEYTRSVLCALLYMVTAAGVQLCDSVNQTLRQAVIFLVCLLLNVLQLSEASIPRGSENLKSACDKGTIQSECLINSSVLMFMNFKIFLILTVCDHSF